jgi:hypothetical protein
VNITDVFQALGFNWQSAVGFSHGDNQHAYDCAVCFGEWKPASPYFPEICPEQPRRHGFVERTRSIHALRGGEQLVLSLALYFIDNQFYVVPYEIVHGCIPERPEGVAPLEWPCHPRGFGALGVIREFAIRLGYEVPL